MEYLGRPKRTHFSSALPTIPRRLSDAQPGTDRINHGLYILKDFQNKEDSRFSPPSLQTSSRYRNIDVLGTIYEGGQVEDEEGNEIIAPTPRGWHVNVRLVGTV